jgi:uncharacterized protein YegP (UPF0339 family)
MFEIDDAAGGGYYWHLKNAHNGQIIFHSEVYATKHNAQRGIAAMKKYVADAPVLDRSRSRPR